MSNLVLDAYLSREGLSISLNFRLRLSTHSSFPSGGGLSSTKHYLHYLLVLLGVRPSTPSQLRSLLLSPGPAPRLDEVVRQIKAAKMGPCYLTFCSAEEVVIIEKGLDGVHESAKDPVVGGHETHGEGEQRSMGDHGMKLRPRNGLRKRKGRSKGPNHEDGSSPTRTGGMQRDHVFAIVTNHDHYAEGLSKSEWTAECKESATAASEVGGFDWILGDSLDRKDCVKNMWGDRRSRAGPSARETRRGLGGGEEEKCADLEEVKEWLRTYPVRNECTHFSCIMDPSREGGGVLWIEACEQV